MIIVVPHVIKNQYITILFYQLSYVSKKFIRCVSCIASSAQIMYYVLRSNFGFFRIMAPHSQSDVFNTVVSQILITQFVYLTLSSLAFASGSFGTLSIDAMLYIYICKLRI